MVQPNRHLPTLLLLFFSQSILASDWPQFRGLNRDNSFPEKQILQTFPKSGLKILWSKPVGPGYSSPIVSNNRVYLTDSLLTNPASLERIHCFDEQTGQPLWTHSYNPNYPDWVFKDSTGMGPTSTPIAHDGKVYSLGAMAHLLCLDAKTGQPLWQKDLAKDYQVKEFSSRSSPLIESNLLILNIGGKPNAAIVAFDKDSGKEIWKSLDEGLTNSSPIILTAAHTRQLIVWTQSSITSLNPSTGQLLWREHLITDNNSAASTPVFNAADNLLLIGGLVMKLDPDKPAATLLWPAEKARAKRILSDTSTPLFRGHEIYWAKPTGELIAVESTTGRELWKTDKITTLKTGCAINLTQCGGLTFIYTDKGDLITANLTAAGYAEISRTHLIDPTYVFGDRKVAWSAPAYANQKIFTRTDNQLLCASLAP
ncbi:MAG TPA: PQQ-binding-like beta-propeller repeat protein [Tepidisphaeraceae bacterium]|jgi:outer membrane protein assembly factor BamB|nr:PQQ-binding-like beta-propeller repeat protein [Tepidisphaeraceae bacterium]